MMKLKLPLAIATLLVLGGCAPVMMTKPGATQAQFDQDWARCHFEGTRRDGIVLPDEMRMCMRGKGYLPAP